MKFYEDDLQGLVDVMTKHTTNPFLKIEVDENGFTHEYEDADSLLEDASLPTHILDFEVTVQCDEGRLYISYDSGSFTEFSTFSIRGEDRWVRTKKSDLEQYFSNNKNTLRTLLRKDRWKIVFSLLLAGLVSLFLLFLSGPSAAYYGFLGVFNILWLGGLMAFQRFYPYSLMYRRDEPFKRYPKQILKATVTLIGVIGAAITIYRFIPV